MAINPSDADRYFSQQKQYGTTSPQRYLYSFSGADAKVLVYFEQRPDLIQYLQSVHTVSISVHEAKGQVRALGHRGIKGMTRSVRTIAGSIILTVINDHPLRVLQDQFIKMVQNDEDDSFKHELLGWSLDMNEVGVGSLENIYAYTNRLSSLLPPFNMALEYVAEQSPITFDATSPRKLFPGASLLIRGIEFIDEALVTSVNDIVSEISLSFIARDYKPISANFLHDGGQPLTEIDIWSRQEDLRKLLYPAVPKKGSALVRPGGENSFEPIDLQ